MLAFLLQISLPVLEKSKLKELPHLELLMQMCMSYRNHSNQVFLKHIP